MPNEKISNQLDVAVGLGKSELADSNLNTGFNFDTKKWEVIVKYHGNLNEIASELDAYVEQLSSNYAIITTSAENISKLANYTQIEYIERPKLLELELNSSAIRSCISEIRQSEYSLTGKGVIVGIIDSGIDFTHKDFRNADGSSRILYIYDQIENKEFNKEQIDNALKSDNPRQTLNHYDNVGHGTAVAGVAGGSGNVYKGIAPECSFIIVKLGERGREFLARTTEIMRAVKYIIDKAIELNMPAAINLSYGTNNGSHSGNSLFETYIDEMAQLWKTAIVVASGNEGASNHHYRDIMQTGITKNIEFSIASGIKSIFIVLWKNFVDEFSVEVVAPNGNTTGIVYRNSSISRYRFSDVNLFIKYGEPTPYNDEEEIFFEFIADDLLSIGVWTIKITGVNIVYGLFDIWLPVTEISTAKTAFLVPNVCTTLTLPSTAQRVITVGGYDSLTDSMASFSGRGYTQNFVYVKPDIVAPAVNVTTAKVGGGYEPFTGTSIAAPHVTGACALLMQWGIVQRNDLFLYAQRLKAYLRLGARRKPNIDYPNTDWGFGSLCISKTLNELKKSSGRVMIQDVSIMQNNHSSYDIEDAIYSNDYMDLVIEYNNIAMDIIKNNPYVYYCKIIESKYGVIYVKRDMYQNFLENGGNKIVTQEPFILGLMNIDAMEKSGVLRLQQQPNLNLRGQGVIIAIIDTGIDYTDKDFIYEDGTTKLISIWDQSLRGNPPKGQCYGTEFKAEQINEALASDNPLNIVPSSDDIGHGTILAKLAAGRENLQNNTIGAAPDSEIVVVKLKQAKDYIMDKNRIPSNVPAFETGDFVNAVNYAYAIANYLRRPISICIGMGTNEGGHNGFSLFERYISEIGSRNGVAVCVATGNEANARHHNFLTLNGEQKSADIEIKVGKNEVGFPLNIWTNASDRISVSIRSPIGEVIQRIQPSANYRQEINLNLSNTTVIVEYFLPVLQGSDQLLKITFANPVEGIWVVTVYADNPIIGSVHSYLPITNFVNEDTYFLSSNPFFTATVPSTAYDIIAVGGYNSNDGGIYVSTGRGPTRLNILKPIIVAPSVNLSGYTGTSLGAAITTGASALLLEWGFVRGNLSTMNSLQIASYLILGATRRPEEMYPNNIWGYGTLDVYNAFKNI